MAASGLEGWVHAALINWANRNGGIQIVRVYGRTEVRNAADGKLIGIVSVKES